jgi:hypothetical protein
VLEPAAGTAAPRGDVPLRSVDFPLDCHESCYCTVLLSSCALYWATVSGVQAV